MGARQGEVALALKDMEHLPAVSKAAWLGNVLEMDDVHRTAILHPGPVVWPTVLAAATLHGMEELLDAAVRGYEAMISIGATLDKRHYAHWHNTATAGVFGAAAAAASLEDADAPRLAAALGLAGSVSGGFWQMRHEPVMAKQWHVAHAQRTGLEAAAFARQGVTGPRFIIEGPQGLHAATCDSPKPMVLAEDWRITEVSFKPWGACRHAHPAIDAALELKARGELEGPVTVATYRDALTFCDRSEPRSVIEAKFSLQHAVAVVMERGVPQLADFEPDAIAALAATRKLVSVEEGPEYTAAYPAHFGARVETAAGSVALADTLGDPERPLDRDGVIAKARALMDWGGLDRTAAEDAIATALEGDHPRDIVRILECRL